jgi:hypothetical protein
MLFLVTGLLNLTSWRSYVSSSSSYSSSSLPSFTIAQNLHDVVGSVLAA